MSENPSSPKHVAIIMDGNGRWAQRRGRPRVFGHVRGARRLTAIVREADRLGVRALTVYAFSTENWERPSTELGVLWRLMKKFLEREAERMSRENVRLRVVGEVERLSPELQKVITDTMARLAGNTGLQFTIAVSYGSRRELTLAARKLAAECLATGRDPATLGEADIDRNLWTSPLEGLSDVDLVIRTSGEMRVSNFMLWQAAYAEFSFVDLCWPDFLPEHFRGIVDDYSRRDRRFGRLSSAPSRAAAVMESSV